MIDNSWRSRLAAAVTPLRAGVSNLEIQGYRPPGVDRYRPSRTAAVLVPVLDQAEPAILLTLRAEDLPNHGGQISFPGGAADLAAETAVQTALREAHEEVGLDPDRVQPLGFLDRYDVISNYRVLPVVGLVDPPHDWQLDRREVAGVFTLPLDVALDLDRYRGWNVVREGQRYALQSIDWRGHNIWGATAAMLLNLARRMKHAGMAGDRA